jgi:diguanylate cyclase (GGDEF)-like protein
VENLQILRRVALESVWGLLEHCAVQELEPGETLLEAGQTNDTMYLVLSGRLSAHLGERDAEFISFLESGQTVGEMSVIDDSPVSANVRAVDATRLLAVDERAFWRLVSASHEFSVNLLFLLAKRLRKNNASLLESARLRRQFERDATVDSLTGLKNRRALDEMLTRVAARFTRSGDPISLMLLDVDHFKRFNDDFGHAAGDHVLRFIGEILTSALRPMDVAARFGGEEFVILLPDTALAGAVIAAERLKTAIAKAPITFDDRVLNGVTASIGVAALVGHDGPEPWLRAADRALYRAKANGRNRVEH